MVSAATEMAVLRNATSTDDGIFEKGCAGPAEIAKRFGITRSKVYEMIKSNELQTAKVGRRRLVPIVAVERLLRNHLTPAT